MRMYLQHLVLVPFYRKAESLSVKPLQHLRFLNMLERSWNEDVRLKTLPIPSGRERVLIKRNKRADDPVSITACV